MKVPISWLQEYIDIADLSVEELAERMTFAGIEIEAIETHGLAVEGLVVGEVVECEAIPESDHLSRCRVFDGSQTLDVVCGAPNCTRGVKAPLAGVGVVMPGGFTIGRRTLMKKYPSEGMLCSAAELGLSQDHDGIMLLDSSLTPGTPLREVLGEAETVFDVEITWNRPDVLSIIGVAREFAALLGRPLKLPEVDFPEELETAASELATVEIDAPQDCPRYTARILQDVRRVPSPDWMSRRLEMCGLRSIDIVVDVSNYVMLECGQPLHTFDYDRIGGRKIIVRRARQDETLLTLDGEERKLDPSLLVIADADRAVAVAGVMGGVGSEIVPETSSVLLESAVFDAPRVKHGATSLGMRSESSHRFERGVDPDLADWASRRAAALLVRYAGARAARGFIDADFRSQERKLVGMRFERARQVIGIPMPDGEMIRYLQSLNIALCLRNPEAAVFEVPSYRVDITHEADLIEEVARLHGLDALPVLRPDARLAPGADNSASRAQARCRQLLTDLGLSEIMNYSFLSAGELDAFSKAAKERRIVLPNPVSADYAVMRDSLLPQLVGAMGHNSARQVSMAAVFEMGRVFFRDEKGKLCEEDRLSIGLYGPVGRSCTDRVRPVDEGEALLWLKGILASLATALQAPVPELEPADCAGLEQGKSARIIMGGRVEGTFGLINKPLCNRLRMATPLVAMEIRRDALLANVFRTPEVENVPVYPGSFRDIALIAGSGITHAEIVGTIRKAAPPELIDVALFDVFEGGAVGAGRRSLAYSLEYRSREKTLRDEEVNSFHDRVKAALRKNPHIEIREG